MVASTDKKPSKTAFVTTYLQKNQQANVKTVNAAWTEAGHAGKLSSTLITSLRAKLGLTGNIRPGFAAASDSASSPKTTRKPATKKLVVTRSAPKLAAATNGTHTAPSAEKKSTPGNRDRVLAEIETDIDRLIFKLMGVGDFQKLEDDLRAARRVITRSHKA